ncbi:MAG: FAD-dependent oxidoreductase [Alphaproteobacteria bacterium]
MREAAVVIVGSGPAGLAAADALSQRSVGPIVILERDDGAGGLPRYCGHPGFGWEYTRRFETGRRFARHLLARLDPARVKVLTRTTALSIAAGSGIRVEAVGPEVGRTSIEARAVILATGAREQSRAARLLPGQRPVQGVITTGMLQQYETRGLAMPGRRAVILGTEHVSFSVLLTARRCGLDVIAMVEPGARNMSFRAAGLVARLAGVPILTETTIEDIEGFGRLEAVVLRTPRGSRRIVCDCLVVTGAFTPDAQLALEAGIEIDKRSGGPVIDQDMRTGVPGVFAAGNLLRPIESSGMAALEGKRAGAAVAAYLAGGGIGGTPSSQPIGLDDAFRYLVPQRWSWDGTALDGAPALRPSLRVLADEHPARVILAAGGEALWKSPAKAWLRERRVPVNLSPLSACPTGEIRVELERV